ncbi:MAG: hypothetical protein Q9178_007943 [Gyalolechia marmorata]
MLVEHSETARRIRQEEERRKAYWDAEVAQFGEDEAKRLAANAEVSSKRPYEVIVSSDPPQPQSDNDDDDNTATPRATVAPTKKQRVYHSGQLIEASKKRGEENARARRFEKALIDRWQCYDE